MKIKQDDLVALINEAIEAKLKDKTDKETVEVEATQQPEVKPATKPDKPNPLENTEFQEKPEKIDLDKASAKTKAVLKSLLINVKK